MVPTANNDHDINLNIQIPVTKTHTITTLNDFHSDSMGMKSEGFIGRFFQIKKGLTSYDNYKFEELCIHPSNSGRHFIRKNKS